MPDITVQSNTWVDLYTASGIAVGTQISVQNKSSGVVTVQTSATEPTDLSGTLLKSYMQATNKSGSTGEWAYSLGSAVINVSIA